MSTAQEFYIKYQTTDDERAPWHETTGTAQDLANMKAAGYIAFTDGEVKPGDQQPHELDPAEYW